jgi:hypothetical protein
MHRDILDALASVGVRPDRDGNLTLSHAAPAPAASAIVRELKLRPPAAEAESDPALRQIRLRDGASVYLASSPNIGADLA